MRLTISTAAALALAATASAAAAQTVDGAALYKQRCMGCHEGAIPKAPTRVQLKQRPQAAIAHALSHGVMKPQASGLSAAQINALAVHLGAPAVAPTKTKPAAKRS